MPSVKAVLAELLRARYGSAAPKVPAYAALGNDILASLFAHRSVRSYGPEPLPAGTLDLLIAAAQSAPSSANLQAWSVVAVEDPARKARLATLCREQRHIYDAPVFLAWLADLSRLRRVSSQLGSPGEGLEYLESFLLAAIDAALAAQNAVVAAESLGLGTVYIGALRNHPEQVAAELNLPPEVLPVFGLVVGYPDTSRPPAEVKPRLPAAAVLHRETYDTAHEQEAWSDYNQTLSAFQASQDLPATGWTPQAAKRVQNGAALGARVGLAETVARLGFKLV